MLFQPKIFKIGDGGQSTNDDSLDRVVKSGVLRVGASLEELPWGAIDQKTGEKIGGEAEIAKLLAKDLGVNVEIINRRFDLLIPELISNRFDVIISGISVTKDREEKIAFSLPYFKTGQVIVVRKDNQSISDIPGLKDKTVGVLSGTTSHTFAYTLPGIKEVRVYDEPGQYFEDTKSGKIDATIYDQPAAYWYVKNNSDLKIVGSLLTSEDYAVGLRKEDVILREGINKTIENVIRSPEYKQIVAQWYGSIQQ